MKMHRIRKPIALAILGCGVLAGGLVARAWSQKAETAAPDDRQADRQAKDKPSTAAVQPAAAPVPAAMSAAPAVATVTVIVPADADVFFDGSPTDETGTQRIFTTPPLTPGQTFYYDIDAQWAANGQSFDQTRKLTLTAGANVTVDFTTPQP
jgi:uncharacterized protein (TIGR03000 family)